MRSDTALQSDVLAELKYGPNVRLADIGVLVDEDAVTLNGFARSYGGKRNAVSAAKRVAGVRAVADDIKVWLPGTEHPTDGDIARAVDNQISVDWSW